MTMTPSGQDADCLRPPDTDDEPWPAPGAEPMDARLASLLCGLCWGFVAGVAFAIAVRAVLR